MIFDQMVAEDTSKNYNIKFFVYELIKLRIC